MMQTDYHRPKTWHHPRLWLRRLLRSWPFAIWLGAGVVFLAIYAGEGQIGGMTGVVETIEEPVAPLETARLKEVCVTVGQHVKAGDVVARMDTTLIDAQIAIDRASASEQTNAVSAYQEGILQLAARLDQAMHDAQVQLEDAKQQQQRDTAQLGALQAELARREQLLAKRLISEQDLGLLRPQIATLEKTVATYPDVLRSHEDQLQSVRRQVAELDKWLRVPSGGNVSGAIDQKSRLRADWLKATLEHSLTQKEMYTLRATRDSVVSRIATLPGDVAAAGTPVVILVAEHSSRIIGFLPEQYAAHTPSGLPVLVWRQSGWGRRFRAKITNVSPEIRGLPVRVSPFGAQPLRGHRVVIDLEEEHDLVPGETVRVREAEAHMLRDAYTTVRDWLRGPGALP